MQRDLRIDFLRFIGLTLIILAHVQAPYILTQVRSFDVPLMVFVSGLAVSGKTFNGYWQYIRKRTLRLVIPVWLFLFVYLTIFYFLQSAVLPEPYLSGDMIVRSFLFLDKSIGYVWIIRVFLLIMVITPLVVNISNRIRSEWIYFGLLFLLIIVHQVACQLFSQLDEGLLKNVLIDFILYVIAYAFPFAVGVRIKDADRNKSIIYIVFLLIMYSTAFIILKSNGKDVISISSEYKFPPQPYFILYGTLICVLLWGTRNFWGKIANNKITSFIGQNTIWIYLWHMPLALFATVFMNNWIMKYIFVYAIAVLVFTIQYHILMRKNNTRLNKYLLG